MFLAGPALAQEIPGNGQTAAAENASGDAATPPSDLAGTPQTNGTEAVLSADSNATNEEDLIWLNFEGTDLRTVLLYLADITGETILPDPGLRGEVTIINPKPVSPQEAKQIIFSILEMSGFTIVYYDDLIKVVRSGDAKTRPIETVQPPESPEEVNTDDIIRAQVVYPRHISAADVEKFIRPLLTKGAGEVIVNEPTGAVIIIDTGPNIKRLMDIIDLIDRVIEGGDIDIRIVPLNYADEKEMAQLMNSIFTSPALQEPSAQRVTVGGAPRVEGAAPAPAEGAAPAPEQPQAPTGEAGATSELELGKVSSKATFIPEIRLHSLIVISARRNFGLITDLISKLDMPSTEEDDTVHIYPLQHARAEDVAATLNDIFSTSSERAERSAAERRTAAEAGGQTPSRLSRSQPPRVTATQQRNTSDQGLSNLAGLVDVLYDEPSNSLIIITSPRYYPMVERLIKRLDQRTPQVLIEAVIVEVTRDKNFSLGVGWKDIIHHADNKYSLVQALDTTLGPAYDVANRNVAAGNVPGFAYAYGKVNERTGQFDPYFTLQTAEGVTDINVLSTPSILAANNQEANISVGKRIPIARYSRGESGTTRDYSYEYTDVNIELTVTPIINKYGEVLMDTKVIVQEALPTDSQADPPVPPVILNRQATTQVVIQDSQTIVIGGLIKDDFTTEVNKIPLLGDIPIVKHAFQRTSTTKAKGELLVFLTPHVVDSSAAGDVMTAAMRDKLRGASSFVDSRDRTMLYDDVNTERSELTIYDDWREFEKNIDRAERYFLIETAKARSGEYDRKYESYIDFGPGISVPKNVPYSGEMMMEQIPYEDEQEYWPNDNIAPYEGDSKPSPFDDTKLLYRENPPAREPDGTPGTPPTKDLLARERQLLGLRDERVP